MTMATVKETHDRVLAGTQAALVSAFNAAYYFCLFYYITKNALVNLILQRQQENQIINIRPCWTSPNQITQRVEKGVRIIPGQMVCRA